MNFSRRLMLLKRPLLMQRTLFKYSCWSCGKEVQSAISNLFCSNCKAIQKPNKKENYFKLMDMEENYDIDDTYLTKKYKDLQRHLHPDKFANKNEKELEISEMYSSLVNEAYKTLQEPLARGVYMLNLRGHNLPENTEVESEFLMDIMEKNEQVEQADTEEAILKLNEENKKEIKDLQIKLSKAFFEGNIKLVTKLLIRMKYYTSIDNQIQSVIRNKGIIR